MLRHQRTAAVGLMDQEPTYHLTEIDGVRTRTLGREIEEHDGLPGYVDAEGNILEGLHCPECGRAMNVRLVASSYPCPGGQYRKRYCDCGAEVITYESPIRRPKIANAFIVHGFPLPRPGGPGGKSGIGQPAHIIAQLVRALGGKVTRFR